MEKIILKEKIRVVSRFPCYVSCYIVENRFSLGQCGLRNPRKVNKPRNFDHQQDQHQQDQHQQDQHQQDQHQQDQHKQDQHQQDQHQQDHHQQDQHQQ